MTSRSTRRTVKLLAVLAITLQVILPANAHEHHHSHDAPPAPVQVYNTSFSASEPYDDAARAAAVSAMLAAARKARDDSEEGHEHQHHHHHGSEPKIMLNETEYELQHGPIAPSYYALDSGSPDVQQLSVMYGSHSGLMVTHIASMVLAFFVFLPIFIFVKIAKHTFLSACSQLLLLTTLAVGLLSGMAYSAATPELYDGQKHGKLGWITSLSVIALSSAQIFRTLSHMLNSKNGDSFKDRLLSLRSSAASTSAQYGPVGAGVVQNDEERGPRISSASTHVNEDASQRSGREDSDSSYWTRHDSSDPRHFSRDNSLSSSDFRPSTSIPRHPETTRWHGHDSSNSERYGMVTSPVSEVTLNGESDYDDTTRYKHARQESEPYEKPLRSSSFDRPQYRASKWATTLKYAEIFAWRALVPLGWANLVTGIVVYGGTCRAEADFKNACLAHHIKGSIFFWYGILYFGRYLGAWAELGWAWNKKPSSTRGTWREHLPSAEMAECSLLCLYGAINTWMERLGVGPNDPFTVHQIQHISIAVMFFFGGGLGMMLESKTVRSWISDSVLQRVDERRATAPTSYSGSFNVFPALIIGITGLAMSAHEQEYAFSMTIHSLWGRLLALAAVCRVLTYTFLFLRPPASILPSRPPTEALTAFFLSAGGIVFMLSSDEVIFWALRNGMDSVMAFANATVAFVCFVFMFVFVLMGLKGWASRRAAK